MANAIQRYAANKACCIAANVQKTDNKIKYGAEDMICCINKDFIANTFVELLMCNPVPIDTTWYRLRYSATYNDTTPTSFPGTINIDQDVLVTSNDGMFTTNLHYPVESVTASSIEDFSFKMYELAKQVVSGDPEVVVEVVEYDTDTSKITVDIYYTSKWGTDTSLLILTRDDYSPLITSTQTNTLSTTSKSTDNCLTSSQLCDIKNWLDDYCQSC